MPTKIKYDLLDDRLVLRDELAFYSSPSLVSIEIEQPPTKTQYYTGESLNLTGIRVRGIFDDGFYRYAVVTEDDITGYDSDTEGNKTITVTIKDKSATFDITVQQDTSFKITINSGSDSQFILPLKYGSGTAHHDLTIDWGDGAVTETVSINAVNQGLTHSYPSANTQYTIKLTGTTYLTTAENNSYFGFGFTANAYGCNVNTNRAKVISVSGSPDNLLSPSMPSKNYCYDSMFQNCTSLVTAPELPATSLATYCYQGMFNGCTSLVNAPTELPALTLTQNCYYAMFQNCTSLVKVPSLPATTVAPYCCVYMFSGCSSLVNFTSELKATILANYCYQYMFSGCTSLVTAPEIKATTFANSCFIQMFYNCTSLNGKTIKLAAAPSTIAWAGNMFNLRSEAPNAILYLNTTQAAVTTYNVTSVTGSYTNLVRSA
jgi:hypothetical protein